MFSSHKPTSLEFPEENTKQETDLVSNTSPVCWELKVFKNSGGLAEDLRPRPLPPTLGAVQKPSACRMNTEHERLSRTHALCAPY